MYYYCYVLLGFWDGLGDILKKILTDIAQPIYVMLGGTSNKFIDKFTEVIGLKSCLQSITNEGFKNLSKSLTFENNTGDKFLNKVLLSSDSNDSSASVLNIFSGKYFIKVLGWSHKDYFDNIGEHSLYSDIIQIMQNGVMPTAMVIFSLIILIELFQITTRTEGMRNSGFEAPFKLMFKVAICKILIDNTHNVLDAIAATGLELFNNLKHSLGYNADSIYDMFMNATKDMKGFNVWTWLSFGILTVVVALLVGLITLAMCFVLLARVIDMYIMIILAPIPFATFSHQELSQVGKNFLKQFVGISLKPAVMYVILIVYLKVMNHVVLGITVDWKETIGLAVAGLIFGPGTLLIPMLLSFIKLIIICAMMYSALANCDKFTKMITGAWY